MSNITSYTNQSGNGEKEFVKFLKSRKKPTLIALSLIFIFPTFIPILWLGANLHIAAAIGIMFAPIISAIVTFICLGLFFLLDRKGAIFFYIKRDEVYIWTRDECHVVMEKDIEKVELRSWKRRSKFPDLPKSIDFLASRTSSHRTSSGSTSTSKESICFIITLKDKSKYYSQSGYNNAMKLLPQWIDFYSNSEAESKIQNTVVGRKIKRSQK